MHSGFSAVIIVFFCATDFNLSEYTDGKKYMRRLETGIYWGYMCMHERLWV